MPSEPPEFDQLWRLMLQRANELQNSQGVAHSLQKKVANRVSDVITSIGRVSDG